MIEYLMDLSHERYVHTTSIGQRAIDETKVTTRTEGDTGITSRFVEGVDADGVHARRVIERIIAAEQARVSAPRA
jgi:phenylpropionate dioxygenase-like ring-hydroxylating dioxygenase large terminal subunit